MFRDDFAFDADRCEGDSGAKVTQTNQVTKVSEVGEVSEGTQAAQAAQAARCLDRLSLTTGETP